MLKQNHGRVNLHIAVRVLQNDLVDRPEVLARVDPASVLGVAQQHVRDVANDRKRNDQTLQNRLVLDLVRFGGQRKRFVAGLADERDLQLSPGRMLIVRAQNSNLILVG